MIVVRAVIPPRDAQCRATARRNGADTVVLIGTKVVVAPLPWSEGASAVFVVMLATREMRIRTRLCCRAAQGM
jgi:hypothetical protein